MTETLTDHLLTQRAFTYFFVGTQCAFGLATVVMLYFLASQRQLLKNMIRKCEKMQKVIAQNSVTLAQVLECQKIEQRTGGNKNANKNSMKVVQPERERERESVTDGLYNALNRMQDKIDEQEQELKEYRARESGGGTAGPCVREASA